MFTWGGVDASDPAVGVDGASPDWAADRGVFATICEQLGPAIDGERDVSRPVERTRTGVTRRLVVPGRNVTVTDVELDAQYPVSSPTELPSGEFLLASQARGTTDDGGGPSTVYVRFDGPASVKSDDGSTVVSFWDRAEVTVGYEPTGCSSPPLLTVEPTPDGVAEAITHLSAAHQTRGPARSHPSFRDHPPLVRVGEENAIPETVRESTPETSVQFRLPASLDALFVAAPLAYYLGTRVVTEDRCAPKLTTFGGVDYRFDPLPAFQHQCAQLLRRVFFLDCQVRRVASGCDGTPRRLRTQFGLDPCTVRTCSPGERLDRYLEIPRRDLDAALPDWHLSTYVAPDQRHARSLPYLLDRLSLVYLPQASRLDRNDLLDSTLTDAYPTRGATGRREVVQPALQAGQVHAWLAPGTPVDAFETTTQAFENQARFRERDRDRMRVSVVLNDDAMDVEHRRVSDIYRECAANLPIDVTVQQRLPRAELRDVLTSDTDFLHYIGHCDDEGLRCPDGNLDVADVGASRTRTFFLNACGSYDQGRALVEQGSVAGAVTFRTVLDRQAARVGTAFARLLVHGFSFERALTLARRRILMGKDYAVVGDGTYALLPSPKQPAVVRIEDDAEGGYRISCAVVNARTNGARYRTPFKNTSALNGTTTRLRLSAEELRAALDGASVPVVYEGDVDWSDEIVERL